ncbi:MAG: hypothetical protein AB9882_03035 [Ignavibacteriaceae bacterium]
MKQFNGEKADIRIIIKKNILPSVLSFIQIAFSLYLINLPLTEYFSFEYSLFAGISTTLLIAIYGVLILKNKEIVTYKLFNSKTLPLSASLFIIPLIIALINSTLAGNCPFYDGIPFYLTIGITAIFIGRGLSILAVSGYQKHPIMILILVIIIILSIPFAEIVLNPQVYFYNPLIAYFPGNIYDESITVTIRFLLYRILNLIFFESIVLIFFKSKVNAKSRGFWIISYSIIISTIFVLISPYIGFSTTQTTLNDKLQRTEITEHFNFQYSDNISEGELDYIKKSSEYYYEELKEYYKTEPKKKIIVYIFSNRIDKKELFGAGNADVAKPWLGQIYLSKESLHRTLKHEISHIFTAEFGKYIFKVADLFNPAMIEGIASASDDIYDDYEIHYLVRTGYKNGYDINIKTTFTGLNFFGNSSTTSYLSSGSFVKYLVDKYGINKFKNLYADSDYKKYYDKNISELNDEYLDYLKINLISGTKSRANYYFGRTGLLQKVCPRYLSNKTDEAYEYIARHEYEKAKTLITDMEKNNGSWLLTYGKSICFEKLDQFEEGIRYLQEKGKNYSGTAYESIINQRRADLLILNNEIESAREIYRILTDTIATHRVYSSALLRVLLLDNVELLRKYIRGEESEKLNILRELFIRSGEIGLIPVIIDLSKNLKEPEVNYIYDKLENLTIKNEYEQLAVYKLAEYSLESGNKDKVKQLLKKIEEYPSESEFTFVITKFRRMFENIYSSEMKRN